jgi:predicted phage tail protein
MSSSSPFSRLFNLGKKLLFQSSRAEAAAQSDIDKLRRKILELKQQNDRFTSLQQNNDLLKEAVASKVNLGPKQPQNKIEDETDRLHAEQLRLFSEKLASYDQSKEGFHSELNQKFDKILGENSEDVHKGNEFRHLSEEEMKLEAEAEEAALEKEPQNNNSTSSGPIDNSVDVDSLLRDSKESDDRPKTH